MRLIYLKRSSLLRTCGKIYTIWQQRWEKGFREDLYSGMFCCPSSYMCPTVLEFPVFSSSQSVLCECVSLVSKVTEFAYSLTL
jgi:hypothetical protein